MYNVIRSTFRRVGMGQNIYNVSLLATRPRDDVIVPAEVEIPITTSSTLPTSEKPYVPQLEAENAKLCAQAAYLSSDIAHAEAIQRGAAQRRLQDARK